MSVEKHGMSIETAASDALMTCDVCLGTQLDRGVMLGYGTSTLLVCKSCLALALKQLSPLHVCSACRHPVFQAPDGTYERTCSCPEDTEISALMHATVTACASMTG